MDSFFTQLSEYDISLLRLIHHNRFSLLDDVLYLISFTTSFVSITLLVVILSTSIKLKSKEIRNKFLKILTVLLVAATLSLSLKNSIFRERPFVNYPDIVKLSEAGSSSFPSGHTIEAFAIALAFSILFPRRKFIVPVFLWAFLVAYSRMALGVHYPADVFAGIIIGVIVSYFTITIYTWIENKNNSSITK